MKNFALCCLRFMFWVMKHAFIHTARAVLLTMTFAVMAAPFARAADRDSIQAFLTITGFDVALDSIALSANDAPEMLGIDAGQFGTEWQRVSREVFDLDLMQGIALDILEDTLTTEALSHAAEFYASDLGQRLVEVENAAHLDDSEETSMLSAEVLASLRENDPERVELFERMQAAIGSAETSVKALQTIQMRFLLAASAAGVIELQLDASELAALLKSQEPELLEAINENGLAHAAWVYRDFSEADLEAYTVALEQPLMQEVYELLNAVQYEITANRFETLASRLAGMEPSQDI